MEVSAKERQRAEHLLQSQRIQLHQIESFSFMKRYRRDPHENIAGGKDRYGPGIFVFHLKEKQDRILHMPPFKHPSSLVRFLVSQGIPFANTLHATGVKARFRQKPISALLCICSGSLYYSSRF